MTTLTLKHPLKAGDKTITELTFLRPRAKGMARFEELAKAGSLINLQIGIIAETARISEELAGELIDEDYEKAAELTADFFPKETDDDSKDGD